MAGERSHTRRSGLEERQGSDVHSEPDREGVDWLTPFLVALALVLLVLLHLVFLASESPRTRGAITVPALVAAGALIWFSLHAHLALAGWEDRLDAVDVVVVMLISLLTLALSVAVFAALTVLGSQQGVLRIDGGDTQGLLQLEQFYLWHAVAAVPLVEVNDTIGWKSEMAPGDTASGILLVGFKIVVLVSLVGVITEFVRLGRRVSTGHLQALRERESLRHASATDADASEWGILRLLMWPWALLLGLLRALPLLVLLGAIPLGLALLVVRFGVIGVSATAVRWLAILLILALAAFQLVIAPSTSGLSGMGATSTFTPVLITMVLIRFSGLAILVVAVSGATGMLLEAGLATNNGKFSDISEYLDIASWYSWHLLEMIPLIELPSSLNWELDMSLSGASVGFAMLSLRLVFAALLFYPVLVAYDHLVAGKSMDHVYGR